MAYTSVIPVHRLDRSIEYVKDKEKTTQKADSLEAAIDYAMNRTKTEQAVFEDTIGCTNENAYADMVATKKRFLFFVKHFSLKKASEFPVFSEGFSLL